LSDDDADDSGKVIMGKTLFGDDEMPVWVAMIVEKSGLLDPTVEDIQEQVRRHWHRGILLLQAEWESCEGENPDGVYERFILFLAQRAGLPAHGHGGATSTEDGLEATGSLSAVPVLLRLGDPGTDERTGQPASWLLNGKGSPHVALMGGTGSGKTRLARSLLGQIRTRTKVPCLIFDFKGDLAGNPAFVAEVGARTVAAPTKPVPLDVFYLADKSQAEITNAAMRFRESFVRIPKNKIGAVQQDALRDAARAAFSKSRPDRPVEIATVRDELNAIYAQTSRKPDVVTSTFNDLTQGGWRLFEPKMAPIDFFRQSWIIDVHAATETAQRLIVFLVLDALWAHFKELPDSGMDDQGHRALRMVLVVDEAQEVLSYGQPSLSKLVRQSRSKGMSVFLISQSPEDYDTSEEDFLQQIGLTVCFRSNGTSPRVLKACLGQTVDLAGLPDGVAVTRLPGQTGISRVKAWE
jgi:DNA sulfur modification protein DndE